MSRSDNHTVPDGTPRPRRSWSSRHPRAHRRGLSALGATLMLSIMISAGFVAWQSTEALRLRDAHLRGLGQWVRAEAAALHHFLHDAHTSPAFPPPAPGTSRRLLAREVAPMKTYRPTWLIPHAGWSVSQVIAVPCAAIEPGDKPRCVQVNDPEGKSPRAHGIVILKVPPGNTARARHVGTLLHDLCTSLATGRAAAEAEHLAVRAAPGTDFGGQGCDRNDPGEAIAVFAAPLAGIDTNLVLREPRSGFPPPSLETDIHLNGNDIAAGRISTKAMTVRTIQPFTADQEAGHTVLHVDGGLTSAGPFAVTGALNADRGQIARRLSAQDVMTGDKLKPPHGPGRLDVTESIAGGRSKPVSTFTLTGPGPGHEIRTLSVEHCTGC